MIDLRLFVAKRKNSDRLKKQPYKTRSKNRAFIHSFWAPRSYELISNAVFCKAYRTSVWAFSFIAVFWKQTHFLPQGKKGFRSKFNSCSPLKIPSFRSLSLILFAIMKMVENSWRHDFGNVCSPSPYQADTACHHFVLPGTLQQAKDITISIGEEGLFSICELLITPMT